MLILGLIGMYFDAAVVFVTKSSLLFRLAVAILWYGLRTVIQETIRLSRQTAVKQGEQRIGDQG
jgi:hypothetical protein